MTREEALNILHNASVYHPDYLDALNMAIKALEQEPTTKIEESNFSQEQYLADIQSAYDCGKSVIDKIKTEIENMQIVYDKSANYKDERTDEEKANDLGKMYKVLVLSIIDKYKAESEGQAN